MKYLDEYRDAGVAQGIVKAVRAQVTQPWVLMEICGGQTHTIMRYGLDEMLPPEIELVHGPGARCVWLRSKSSTRGWPSRRDRG